jgi:hypothetical protein
VRGRKHLNEGAISRALEVWQVSGITTFSSGLPFDIYTAVDSAHTGFAQRPDYSPSAALLPAGDVRPQNRA